MRARAGPLVSMQRATERYWRGDAGSRSGEGVPMDGQQSLKANLRGPWDVVRKPDGSVWIRRAGPSRLLGLVPLGLSLFLCWLLRPVIPCFIARHSLLAFGM